MTELATAPPSNYESGPCVVCLAAQYSLLYLHCKKKAHSRLCRQSHLEQIQIHLNVFCIHPELQAQQHAACDQLSDFPRVPLSSVTPAVYLQSPMPPSERRVNSVTILLKDDYSSTSRLRIHKHDILTPSEKYFLA